MCIRDRNDTVAVDELEGRNFGDNDTLSAIVASIINADVLMILTDIDGVYDLSLIHIWETSPQG